MPGLNSSNKLLGSTGNARMPAVICCILKSTAFLGKPQECQKQGAGGLGTPLFSVGGQSICESPPFNWLVILNYKLMISK